MRRRTGLAWAGAAVLVWGEWFASEGLPDTRVIFSGGATGNGAAEARLMADYAKGVLAFDGTVLLEDRSTTRVSSGAVETGTR